MTTGRGRVALLAMALAAVAVGCGGETIEPDELSGRMAFTGFRDGNTPTSSRSWSSDSAATRRASCS
jgi:hypothetical protein